MTGDSVDDMRRWAQDQAIHAGMTESLYDRYGKSILGPWEDQTPEVRRAWANLAAKVMELQARG